MKKSPLNLNKMRGMYNSLPSKKDFIDKTGISLSALHYVLDGVTSPSAKVIAAFAAYFKVSCGELFSDYELYHDVGAFSENMRKYSKSVVLKDAVLFYNE